jgi:predicted HTH domain antitoxin
MPSATISARLDLEEVKLLESLAEMSGFDRSTLIKSLLRKGMKELRLEQAIEAYRKERITLSRAAEVAGLSVWDFVAGMQKEGLELHYGVRDFEADLELLAEKP